MLQIDLNNISPEPIQGHTSKGDQPKWRVGDRWIKADHMGCEALAEVVISRLLEKSNVEDFVRYEPVQILADGKTLTGCISDNFREKNEMLIPLERLHRAYHGHGLAETLAGMSDVKERIRYTVDFTQSATGLPMMGEYLTKLLEIDAFFLNEDRHTNNLAVIRNENTMTFRLCPVFDNGLSLLSDLNDYPLNEDVYSSIARVKAKPFHTDFDEQMSAAWDLYGAKLVFNFTKQDVTAALEGLDEFYESRFLQRTETVLLEQMRKYPVLW